MKTTLSIIKADIGRIGGHIKPSPKLLNRVQEFVWKNSKDMVYEFDGNRDGVRGSAHEPFLLFAADRTNPETYNLPSLHYVTDMGRDVPRSSDLKIVRLFLSSPGDVLERTLVPRVIFRFNQHAVEDRGLFVKLVWWENMVPQIGPKAQNVINSQTGDCHLFCGIMWNHFGTPTEIEASGTKEEFEGALRSWRKQGEPWIIFYFCDRPATFTTEEQLNQKRKVLQFRDLLKEMGLVKRFKAEQEFEKMFYEDLNKITKLPDFLRLLDPG